MTFNSANTAIVENTRNTFIMREIYSVQTYVQGQSGFYFVF